MNSAFSHNKTRHNSGPWLPQYGQRTCCLLLLLLLGLCAKAQQVKGTVTDGTVPLENVSVFEKDNPSHGVLTDEKGHYSIRIAPGKNVVLVFSNVGFISQAITADRAIINVELEQEKKNLDNVVIIGYGKKKKITNTGAVSMVTGSELRQSPSASLQNALVGRLPGFFAQQRSGQPGKDGADFQIRGVSTYNGSNNSPLIVVDDIETPYSQVKDIDPNEIESVSILKDASTTAVYGIKGANGVVVITTRRGKNGPPKINFRTEAGLQSPTLYFNFLPSYQNLLLLREQYISTNIDPLTQGTNLFTDADIAHFKNHDDPYGHPDVDWVKTITRPNALQLRNNIDISGGTKKVKYFVSAGYIYQNGILKDFSKPEGYTNNYFYKRYNFRSNLDVQASQNTSFRVDLSGRFGETNEPNIDDANMTGGAWPLWRQLMSGVLANYGYPVYNADGSYGGRIGKAINPVGLLRYGGYKRSYDNNFNLNFTANQQLGFILKGLSARATLAYSSLYTYNRNLTRNDFPMYTYDSLAQKYVLVNLNQQLYRVPQFSFAYTPGGSTKIINTQAALNYSRSIAAVHHVSAMILYNQSSTIAPDNTTTVNNYIPTNYRGFAGRVGYDYKARYLLDFNMGYNGSDRFKAKKKYDFFPAVSAGWNISEEPFFKRNIRFIDNLKIRGSWGIVGSDNIGGYQYLYAEVYNSSTTAGGGYSFGPNANLLPGITPGSLGNDNVQWEKEKQKDLGIEMSLFNSRLQITADYFDRYRYDILDKPKSIPGFAGLGSSLPAMNLGKVSNKGFELEISYRGHIAALNYFVRGNISYAKNKIIFQDEVAPKYPQLAATGKPIGQQFGYVWTGKFYNDLLDVDTSAKPAGVVMPGGLKYVDFNGDKVIDDADKRAIGKPNIPTTYYGFSLGLSYKGLDFSVLFQGTKGSSFVTDISSFGNNTKAMDVHLERWTPETAGYAVTPRLGNGNLSGLGSYMSTFWLRSADYLRLKNVEIGYTLPARLVKPLHLESIRFYANGLNLYTWFKLKVYNIDPENTSGNNTNALNTYPQQKVYNFGASVTF